MRWTAMGAALLLLAAGCTAGGAEKAGGSGRDPDTPATAPATTPGSSEEAKPSGDDGATATPTASDEAATPGTSDGTSPAVTGAGKGCHGMPVLTSGGGFPEVRGEGRGAEVWGLLFAPVPFRKGREVKIVWRMTGEGPLTVTATLPDGTRARRTFGPEQHGGSNWKRPGEEWGTGFVFPKPGCWKVELSRTRGSGQVWLPVR
ncbi:hypothetical protein ACIBG4_28255 [Nonomuraea sp. NPDC050383]|uniref:hypothetical protein n=1 Tax=Nonomuraea sp. NPDC050383 TaxID=3364362 RepID=UPI0037A985E4